MSSQAPIGQRNTVPSDGFDQGEHGAGVGVSGGLEREKQAVGGAGIPGQGQHPIADKFMGNEGQSGLTGSGAGLGGAGTTGQRFSDSSTHTHSHASHPHDDLNLGAPIGVSGGHSGHGHNHGLTTSTGATGATGATSGLGGSTGRGGAGNTVSGAYEGGAATDALSGESHARTTGAGVGPLGENLQGSGHGHPTSSITSSSAPSKVTDSRGHTGHGGALAGAGAGAAGLGAAGAYGGLQHGDRQPTQTTGTTSGTTAGTAVGGAGVGAASTGVGGQTASGNLASNTAGGQDAPTKADSSNRTGHYGTVDDDSSRGKPISDPKHLDSGGPHGLVYQESTGTYVHRRDL